VLWAGILASVVASLHAAGALWHPDWLTPAWAKFLAAAIAGVPALAIMIDKTFKWSARSAWRALYELHLRALLRTMRDRQGSLSDVSQSLDALELEMHNTFPPLDASVLAPGK
jgi:hypothetical protein